MSLVLGSVADDYTGASDLANTLTRAGLRTVQTIGVPPASLDLPDVDAVVVALKIRSCPASEAVEKAQAGAAWLRSRGAGHVMYKICSTFDSTDAGNIGPVMDALRKEAGQSIVLVTSAFPQTGRTIFQGNLFVGAVPLDESPLKDHPLNPMRDANLVRVLSRQSKGPVGLVDLATVAGGPGAIRARLDALVASGVRAAIVDGVFDADLLPAGSVALEQAVSVGASGLGFGLARAVRSTASETSSPAVLDPVGGLVACLAGSCSSATLDQIAEAERTMPVLRLDPSRVIDDDGEVDRAAAWALERIGSGPVLVATSAPPDAVAAVQARYGREAAGHALEAALARVAQSLIAAGVRRLVVAGGETSGAVVDRLGLPAFRIGPEIAPGVPVLQAVTGSPLLLALKSGNFGARTFFSDALMLMR